MWGVPFGEGSLELGKGSGGSLVAGILTPLRRPHVQLQPCSPASIYTRKQPGIHNEGARAAKGEGVCGGISAEAGARGGCCVAGLPNRFSALLAQVNGCNGAPDRRGAADWDLPAPVSSATLPPIPTFTLRPTLLNEYGQFTRPPFRPDKAPEKNAAPKNPARAERTGVNERVECREREDKGTRGTRVAKKCIHRLAVHSQLF